MDYITLAINKDEPPTISPALTLLLRRSTCWRTSVTSLNEVSVRTNNRPTLDM